MSLLTKLFRKKDRQSSSGASMSSGNSRRKHSNSSKRHDNNSRASSNVSASSATLGQGSSRTKQPHQQEDEEPPKNNSNNRTPSPVGSNNAFSPSETFTMPLSYQSGTRSDGYGSSDVSSHDGASCTAKRRNPKEFRHFSSSRFSTSSAIGLDEMIEDRREGGSLMQNVVHIEVPCGKPVEEVYEGVHDGPILGSGISGEVRLVTHRATGIKYAVKVLDLELVNDPMQLRNEILIMSNLDHPNIVRLEEVYESAREIYLVQELCLGGELFDRLDEQPDYHYSEAECARLIKQMLSAVRYLHSKGIIHRDLKLENFLFTSDQADSELKLIDFGLSKHFQNGEVHHEAVGTPYTVAPEVIRGSYDELCDVWAIGVITYLLLSGIPPFGGCGGPEPLTMVRTNILNGFYSFEPPDIWDYVSVQARDFIQTLLVTDPKKRPTAEQAQQHEWIQEWVRIRNAGGDRALNPNVIKALVSFKNLSDIHKLLHEVLSFTLLPEQIKGLRLEFEKMDTDGSGEISLATLKQVLMENARLSEKEVTDIFDAMRVHKNDMHVHWHEFLAAGLSQCSVDDRNLRLAFERLDSDHKGLITLDDIKDLLGGDAPRNEEELREMWGESTKAARLIDEGITFDDFKSLVKGNIRRRYSNDGGSVRCARSFTNGNAAPAKITCSSNFTLRSVPEEAGGIPLSPPRALDANTSPPQERSIPISSTDSLERPFLLFKMALGICST